MTWNSAPWHCWWTFNVSLYNESFRKDLFKDFESLWLVQTQELPLFAPERGTVSHPRARGDKQEVIG